MRKLLYAIFWITSVGGVIQLLVILTAIWILSSSSYELLQLDVNVFITEFVPWLIWFQTFIIALFGELGRLLLGIPILIVAPLKLIAGTAIGYWAYSAAKRTSAGPVVT